MPSSGAAGSYSSSIPRFLRNFHTIFHLQFTFPSTVQECFLFFTPFPSCIVCRFFGEKTKIEKDTCIPLFIAALFTIARTWKQPRCPSADKWIRKLWYIYTVGYYSAIKKNTLESVLVRWMKLESIIQSEGSQKENHQYSISSVQSLSRV